MVVGNRAEWFCSGGSSFIGVYGLDKPHGMDGVQDRAARDRASPSFIAVIGDRDIRVRIGVSEGASVLNVHPGILNMADVLPAVGYRGKWLEFCVHERACRIRGRSLALSCRPGLTR